MSTALVTGGAGFIGSHIAEELSRKGFNLRILDNFSTGKKENLQDIKAELTKGDIKDFSIVKKAMKDIDYVFHEGAFVYVTKSIENPLLTNEINVNGTLNVLVAARDSGCKKIVFASSSSVYGNTGKLPIKENFSLNPASPYAVTKMVGEQYSRVFYENYGLESVCLRYFNVYGPRQDPNSEYSAVIPKFIHLIKQNKPPVIFGDGEQTRDFIFVKDVVQANMLSMKYKGFGIFNVGSGTSITINELAEKIGYVLNNKIKPVHAESRKGDARNSLSDITNAKKLLGLKPAYSIDSGLKETI
jgi:UDP-glucose 4-epimerase